MCASFAVHTGVGSHARILNFTHGTDDVLSRFALIWREALRAEMRRPIDKGVGMSKLLIAALSIILLNVSHLAVARADERAEIRKQLDTEMAGVREHDIIKVMSVYAPGTQLVVYDA